MHTNPFNQSPPRRCGSFSDDSEWGENAVWDVTTKEPSRRHGPMQQSGWVPEQEHPTTKQELMNMAILPSISKALKREGNRNVGNRKQVEQTYKPTNRNQARTQSGMMSSSYGKAAPPPSFVKSFGLTAASWSKGRVIAQMEDGLRSIQPDGRIMVASDSANYRVVDTIDLTCNCPRDGLCGHLAALALAKKEYCLPIVIAIYIRQSLWER